jgi:serine/threonine-protein kinase
MPRRPLLEDTPTQQFGPYRLAHRIAVGGMAEVYRALWPQAAGGDRAVVIKRMLPSLLDDPEQRAMFEREANLGSRIDHANVVGVLDHGTDGEVPYLVLEYVFGVDLWRLSRWMRRTGQTLRVPLAVWVAREMLAGLAAVHDVRDDAGAPLHVVHRDVSPSNLFLSVHGDVKLGDLGIARAALQHRPRRRAGPGFRAKGKLGYLPPEQVAGKEVDPRGDVFAAAVVLAELLMGRPLFSGGTEIGVLLAIRDGDLSPFRAVVPRLPPGLGEVVLRALARRPERRTPTAGTLRDELAPFVAGEAPAELRAELGRLVVGALDDEEARDRTSLAATIEKDAAWFEAETPAEPAPEPPRDSASLYRVERDGELLGVFTLAELVRALTTQEVRATDAVRVEEGPARPLAAVPELSRHLPPSTRTPTARRRTRMAETSELYDLSSRSALAVLAGAYLARDDGLLLCGRGEVRKEVYLLRGVPAFVTSNQPGELLGEALVARGVIDRAELDLALATMPRFEGRLGETLVALGLVDAVVLFRHIAEQVRGKLLELFVWPSGHAALYRGVDRPERAFPLQTDPWELLERGARRRVEAGLETARFADRGRDALVRVGDLDLGPGTPSERIEAIWTACAAPRALGELADLAPDAAGLRAAVLVLLELGVLRWRGDAVG